VLLRKFLVNVWGEAFCVEHEGTFPVCSFCSRLIPPDQQTPGWDAYESQRCFTCRATAIEVIEQAQPLYRQLKQWIITQGFRFNQLPLHLELCGRARLHTLLGGRNVNHPLGVTLTSNLNMFGRTMTSQVEGVAVAQGMPALLFSGTVLHELGHAWLTVHGVEKLPLWASEGFCELLA